MDPRTTVRIDISGLEEILRATGKSPEQLRRGTGVDSMLLHRISLGYNEVTVGQAAGICSALGIEPRRILHESGEIQDVVKAMEG